MKRLKNAFILTVIKFNMNVNKIRVCVCEQCRASKRKTKNRKYKKRVKRMLNRLRRRSEGRIINFYWA